jgi:hypothetical protein
MPVAEPYFCPRMTSTANGQLHAEGHQVQARNPLASETVTSGGVLSHHYHCEVDVHDLLEGNLTGGQGRLACLERGVLHWL